MILLLKVATGGSDGNVETFLSSQYSFWHVYIVLRSCTRGKNHTQYTLGKFVCMFFLSGHQAIPRDNFLDYWRQALTQY